MASKPQFGYLGRLLRVDLSSGQSTVEELDEPTLRKYIGGAILGAKLLYEEVPPGVKWRDPGNRLVMASGPLGATRVGGSGTFCVVTKGALTEGATSVQANGFWGAFLRLSGFDGIVLQGVASNLSYLYIHDGRSELREAGHLTGKGLWETEDIIKSELGKRQRDISVFGVGPAGENLVRFAAIVGDRGHVAAHNGTGAVMGSKNLKAVAVGRGKTKIPLANAERLSQLSAEMLENRRDRPAMADVYRWGTLQGMGLEMKTGRLPVKNYTTSVYSIEPDALEKFGPEYIRGRFNPKPNPCWACQMNHCNLMTIGDGPYAGETLEEPEYEGFASWGPGIGQADVASTMVLARDVDSLGMDTNEACWVVGLVMECYEKGILTKGDTDGLEMTWGNVEATRKLLRKIAFREGFGSVLAEGAMRAARIIGRGAPELAVHTMKGNTPRSHDHRSAWFELFDTCVSNTGTIETSHLMPCEQLGLKRPAPFSPEEISTVAALTKGSMQFEDSLGVCRFNTSTDMIRLTTALNAATGWEFTLQDSMEAGRRAVNLFRLFNLRHGIYSDLDFPSPRYGSTPTDGPSRGMSIMTKWTEMLRKYYELMGWDSNGRPLPDTLKRLGLEHVLADHPSA